MNPSDEAVQIGGYAQRRDSVSEFGVVDGLRPLPRPRTFEHTPGGVMRAGKPTLESRSAEADSVSGGLAPGRTPPARARIGIDHDTLPNIER